MKYPQLIEYNEALQHPQTAFLDPELQRGRVRQTPLGLPLALAGAFALTYEVEFEGKRHAVRCFHREVPSVKQRYQTISAKLKSLSSNYFVDFDFQDDGIRVGSSSFPIVKMQWAPGDTLAVYLSKDRKNKSRYSKLRENFRKLARFLEENNIAHGDIQNDNVIINDNCDVILVDYDGMFVDGLKEGDGNEFGHPNFQHPDRTEKHFGPKMDRFSFIVMDISLEALAEKPSLFQEFGDGGQAIIFKVSDYVESEASEALKRITAISTSLADTAQKLKAVCACPMEEIPSLEDFLSGKRIPSPAINVRTLGARGRARSDASSPSARLPNQKIIETLLASGRTHPGFQTATTSNIHILNTVRNLGAATQRAPNFSRQAFQATPMRAARPRASRIFDRTAVVSFCILAFCFIALWLFRPSYTSAPTREGCEKWSGKTCQMYGGRWWSIDHSQSKESCEAWSGQTPCKNFGGSWWSSSQYGGQPTVAPIQNAGNQAPTTTTTNAASVDHNKSKEACEKWSGQPCTNYGGIWWSENQYKATQTPTVTETHVYRSDSKKTCELRYGQPCFNDGGSWWYPTQFGGKQEATGEKSKIPRMFQVDKKP